MAFCKYSHPLYIFPIPPVAAPNNISFLLSERLNNLLAQPFPIGLNIFISQRFGMWINCLFLNKRLVEARWNSQVEGAIIFKFEYLLKILYFSSNWNLQNNISRFLWSNGQSIHFSKYFVQSKAWWHPPVKGHISCINQKTGRPNFKILSTS